ncbi:MAG: outer membrane protein assembly factor BamD [Alphaproteobacteria bacterium]|nr:outer membrane protein assembly factor BamD [Alphaproteobacteria bacterium]
MIFRKFFLFTMIVVSLSACSSSGGKKEKVEADSVEALYERADTALKKKNYVEATKYFEELERQHPYSEWSVRAQIMGAYASYLDQRYDEAIASIDRYIQLHPGAEDVDYAYYLKAMSYYEQISDVRRDQNMTIDALRAFNTLIGRFPNSEYSRDASLKRDLAMDHLAGKEMEVGRYYLERGHVNAAINRFRSVIVNFQTTSHVPEALHRLVEAYLTLGLKHEALKVAAVLGHNYPGSKWYERSYALLDPASRSKIDDDKGFFTRTIESLLSPG